MEINEELVKKVAKTARIRLEDDQLKQFTKEFEEILALFSQLKDVNTDNVHPSFQPIDKKNHLRDDEVKKCISQEEATSLAKHHKDGYFKSPRAIQ